MCLFSFDHILFMGLLRFNSRTSGVWEALRLILLSMFTIRLLGQVCLGRAVLFVGM